MKILIDEDTKRTSVLILLALLILLCLLLYAPSLSYFFAQDDFFFLSRASESEFGDPASLFKPFGPFYRPLSTSIYFTGMLRLFGLRPVPYHALSLGLFCVNVLLVFCIGDALFGGREKGFITALFYLTRGMHFEAVSWVSGIQDLLMTFFVLTSMISYLKYSEEKRRLLPFSLIMFVLALLSKETAVIFPFVLLSYEFIVNKERVGWKRLVGISLFFLVAAIYLTGHFLFIESMPKEGRYATGLGLFWVSNLVNYFMACINILFLPFVMLPRFHRHSLQFFFVVLAVCLVAFLLISRRHKRNEETIRTVNEQSKTAGYIRLMGLGTIFFVLGALPALPFKDRFEPYYMSLASVGISIALAAALSLLTDKRLKTVILAGTCIISLAINMQFRTKRLSHVGKFSPIARDAIHELRPLLADAPPGSTLYISGSDGYLWLALAWGSGIKVFFPQVESVIFDNISRDYRPDGSEIVFDYTPWSETE